MMVKQQVPKSGVVLDWTGKVVADKESDNTSILVWKITPHPQTDDYDCCLIRGYQEARRQADLAMERVMDASEKDDLIDGVKVEVSLVETTVGEMNDLKQWEDW